MSKVMLLLASCLALPAQPPAAAPDVLLLSNGEKLIGRLVRANGGKVIFKSDTAGQVTVDWSKIRELHSARVFTVIRKDVQLGHRADLSHVPAGTLDVAGQTVTLVQPGESPLSIPVANAAHVLDQETFRNEILHNPGLLEKWTGAITAGATIVEATQQSRAFNGAISLIRAIPPENWLDARNRTTIDFNAATGYLVQPHSPKLKTEMFHADAERDQYFRGKAVYAFAQTGFDHNYSQGLDLQENFGGGIGWTAIKHPNTTFDLKGSLSYTRQNFAGGASSQDLIGSVFSESLAHKTARGILLVEQGSVTPSWNNSQAYAAAGSASLTVPVYKRLAFSIGVLDTFLNDPPPGFKKNSFQLNTGLTYSLR